MLGFKRFLAFVCYTAMLAADAAAGWIIYASYNGKEVPFLKGTMTYHLALMYFVPIFIFTYWMSTFFTQLTDGKVNGKRVCPKWLKGFLNFVGTAISLALIVFWIYIYYNQSKYDAAGDSLTQEIFILRNYFNF